MIERKLYNVIRAQVDAAASGTPLAGLFVHDSLFRSIDPAQPDGFRVGRAEGELAPNSGNDGIREAYCGVPVFIYVLIADVQDDGTIREAAFDRATAIAYAFVLTLWTGALDAQSLILQDGAMPFARVDHTRGSDHYAVVTFTLTLSEVVC